MHSTATPAMQARMQARIQGQGRELDAMALSGDINNRTSRPSEASAWADEGLDCLDQNLGRRDRVDEETERMNVGRV